MTEGEPHKDAVTRTKGILRGVMGWKILENSDERGKGGFQFPNILVEGRMIQWTADICAHADGRRIIVEIDGQKPGQGHNSEYAKARDHRRSMFLYQFFGIRTVRLWVSELVGKGAMEDSLIIMEIVFQLNHWEQHGRPTLK